MESNQLPTTSMASSDLPPAYEEPTASTASLDLPPSYQDLYPPEPPLSPTVVPSIEFNANADLLLLAKALGTNDTDKKSIVNILANRSHLQRLEIAELFKRVKGRDITEVLKLVLVGDFKNLIVALMIPLSDFYAKELHRAMTGPGTKTSVLIDILCTLPKSEILCIRRSYEKMYKNSLDTDLQRTSGNFKKFLISLCVAKRDERRVVNYQDSLRDASKLEAASKEKTEDAEIEFIDIFVRRNHCQLKRIFKDYAGMAGHDILTTINKKFSGDLKKGLITMQNFIQNTTGFLAEKIYKSAHGRDDRRLIRLIVTRSEIDMGAIKTSFTEKYDQSLEHLLSVETSGSYKKCLLALITPGVSIIP